MKTLILLLSLTCFGQAQAGWFGPSNADECMQEHLDEVHSEVASRKLNDVCRQQFPTQPDEKKATYINPDFILAQKDVDGHWWRLIKNTWYLYKRGWVGMSMQGHVPAFSRDPEIQQQVLQYFGFNADVDRVEQSQPSPGKMLTAIGGYV